MRRVLSTQAGARGPCGMITVMLSPWALSRWALALWVLSLSGCAPHVTPGPPNLGGSAIQTRFARRLAERATRGAVAEGSYAIWAHRPGARTLPGVSARVRCSAPDAIRLRVDALLGVAIEVALHRDTLVLQAPSLGVTAVSDAGDDHSSRQDLGRWAWQALSGTWLPPAESWGSATEQDSTLRLAWVDAADSLALEIGSTGLPRSVRIRPAGGEAIVIRYERWATWDGLLWPARLVAADAVGRLSATLQPQDLRLRPASAASASPLRVPARAVRLSRSDLLEWVMRVATSAGSDSLGVGE